MMPACSHTGTPSIAFEGFRHFTASTTSGSAALMSARTRASVSPRQSPSAAMRASIRWEGEAPLAFLGPLLLFFPVIVAFCMVVASGLPLRSFQHGDSRYNCRMASDSKPYVPFSQRTGLEPTPPQLKVGEVSAELRRLLYYYISLEIDRESSYAP